MALSESQAGATSYFHSRECLPVRDADLLHKAFELRYQIYCLECRFLDATDYPGQFEQDEFDEASAHFCSYNLRDELVGYVRLIRPTDATPLPVLARCRPDTATARPQAESAEISRLMVREDYRRRRGDSLSGVSLDGEAVAQDGDRRTKSPRILLSLFRQMYRASLQSGIRYWFAAMEPSLARVLTRMHFCFTQIGPTTDYYGPVAPYVADLRDLEVSVQRRDPALMRWLTSDSDAEL